LCASLLTIFAIACDEDGKTAPETCATPPLEIYDIQDPPSSSGAGSEENPCVTPVGHAVSPTGGGTDAGAGSTNGGRAGRGGNSASDAGAGGALDMAGAGGG
jgi:hypothetical protein